MKSHDKGKKNENSLSGTKASEGRRQKYWRVSLQEFLLESSLMYEASQGEANRVQNIF